MQEIKNFGCYRLEPQDKNLGVLVCASCSYHTFHIYGCGRIDDGTNLYVCDKCKHEHFGVRELKALLTA